MAVSVKENWSGKSLNFRWPWTAVREFTVAGTADESEALAAVDPNTALAVPQTNAAHPYNSRLRCEGPAIKSSDGPEFFTVTCPYSIPESGQHPDGAEEDDPLTAPARIGWRSVRISEQTDVDLGNLPILNSAGDPTGPMPREVPAKQLVIVKNMPFYDINQAESFELAVNSAAVDFSGVVQAKVQHMFCESIQPAVSDYTADAPYLPIAFSFLVVFSDALGSYPFQFRVMDAGRNGWFTADGVTSSAGFVNAKTRDVLDSVRLDGTGKPLTKIHPSGSIKVGDRLGTPVSPPHVPAVYVRECYNAAGTLQGDTADANTVAVWHVWQRARVVDFSPLLALL